MGFVCLHVPFLENIMQTTKTNNTTFLPHQKVQAAYRYTNPFDRGTEKSVCQRYGITPKQLEKAVADFDNCKFKKGRNWNPSWNSSSVIHHVVDTATMVDIEKGSKKGSDFDLFLDPDFDAVNGLLHVNWTDNDVLALCEGLPRRIIEILRDSTPGDELYQEALRFTECKLFEQICEFYQIDAEILVKRALEITKAHL